MSLHLAFRPLTPPFLVGVGILVQLLARISKLCPAPRAAMELTEVDKTC